MVTGKRDFYGSSKVRTNHISKNFKVFKKEKKELIPLKLPSTVFRLLSVANNKKKGKELTRSIEVQKNNVYFVFKQNKITQTRYKDKKG